MGSCCWLWRWCEFFLLVVPGFFFFCWICGFVEFWLFLCVILVGFWDDFVANLMDLSCVNGGLWTVEVVVGGNGGGWGFGFAYCSLESSNDWFVVFFFFFFWQWDVLFYYSRYIILLWCLYYFIVLKVKIDPLLQDVL